MQWSGKKQWLVFSLLAVLLLPSTFSFFPLTPAFADITNSAVIAYRSNTGTAALESPKVRMYDNAADTWGSELELSDTNSNVRDTRVKCSPTDGKCVVVSLSADGTLNAWVCTSTCTSATSWTNNHQSDFADLWSAEPANPTRLFDMCFEDQSGDLLVIYDKESTVSGEELFYRVMTDAGTTFGSETAINTQTADSATDRLIPFVRCASYDGTDFIGRVELDRSNNDANAGMWDGSVWENNTSITGSSVTVDEEQIGIAWETNSGHLLACGSAGAQITCAEFTTSWQAPANVGGVATGVGNVNWIQMKSTPRSAGNEIFLAFSGDLFDFASIQWSGTAWGTGTEHDAGIDTHGGRGFEIALSPAADGDSATVDALLIWGTANNAINYRSWSATNTYGTASTITNSGTHIWFNCPEVANPTSGDSIDSICGVLDSAFDISRIEWTGGTNAPTDLDDEVTADTVVTTWESMDLDWIYAAFSGASFDVTPNLSITVSQTINPDASFFRVLTAAITVDNTVDPTQALFKLVTNAITVDATHTEVANFFRTALQTITVTDTAEAFRAFFVLVEQGITLADTVTRTAAYFVTATLSLTVSDVLDTMAELFITVPQSIDVEDSVSRVAAFFRTVQQTIQADDTVTRLRESFVQINQGLTASLDVATNSLRQVLVTLNINLANVATRIGGAVGAATCELERLGILLDLPLPCEGG